MTSFYDACRNGNIKQVLQCIKEEIIDFDFGLISACQGGHKEIIELMIEKGATNFNEGLDNACYGGYIEIVELMIEKGANIFNWGLDSACHNGNKKLVLLMIEKGADIKYCHIELNIEDIYYLYQKGVKSSEKYKELFIQCENIRKIFIETLSNFFISDITKIISNY